MRSISWGWRISAPCRTEKRPLYAPTSRRNRPPYAPVDALAYPRNAPRYAPLSPEAWQVYQGGYDEVCRTFRSHSWAQLLRSSPGKFREVYQTLAEVTAWICRKDLQLVMATSPQLVGMFCPECDEGGH